MLPTISITENKISETLSISFRLNTLEAQTFFLAFKINEGEKNTFWHSQYKLIFEAIKGAEDLHQKTEKLSTP